MLNVIDPTGALINRTIADDRYLPQTYGKGECIFTITPEGDSVMLDGKHYGNDDPVISETKTMLNSAPDAPIEQ